MKNLKDKVRMAILLDLIAMLVIGIVGVVVAKMSFTMILLIVEAILAMDVIAASKFLQKLNK